jgi:hypothetical protein
VIDLFLLDPAVNGLFCDAEISRNFEGKQESIRKFGHFHISGCQYSLHALQNHTSRPSQTEASSLRCVSELPQCGQVISQPPFRCALANQRRVLRRHRLVLNLRLADGVGFMPVVCHLNWRRIPEPSLLVQPGRRMWNFRFI